MTDPHDAQAVRDQDRPWFTLTPETALERVGVDVGRGLSTENARSRLERHGPNELVREAGPSPWRILWNQLKEPLVLVLIAAAAVSGLVWLLQDTGGGLPYDAIVILAIVVLNALLGFVQEYRAERAVESLKEIMAPEVRVRRGGRERRVPATELVPGDILLLEAGDRVPADARLVEVSSLKTDEAPLTGESVAVSKQPDPLENVATVVADRTNMVFMGSSVTYGHAEAVVVATGMNTEMGGIARMLQAAEAKQTPLQQELARIGKQLGLLVLVISALVAIASVIREGSLSADTLFRMFLFGVALAVAAVPEGLPAVVTASLAAGVRRLAAQSAIVRRLPAVETLGSADVICTDKTGTVTKSEMTVRRILLGGGRELDVSGEGFTPQGAFREAGEDEVRPQQDEALMRLLRMAALNNDADLVQDDEHWGVDGDPTEGALLVVARKAGIENARLQQEVPRENEIPFSGERKRMTTIHTLDNARTAIVKGGPELILERCVRVRVGDGDRELDAATRSAILERNERYAEEALRTLAFASRTLPPDVAGDDAHEVERDLVFDGIFGMIDPPRPESRTAVERAARAGIRTILLTGDHVLTARAIARRTAIVGENAEVLSGREVAAMTDDELEGRVADVSVYGRVGPEDKIRILRALKRRRHLVAMTGDGVNDAPAVKEADIGVAMGGAGTEVTKEASDVVLMDDNFATIVNAVSEGRRVFSNLRNFVRYLLSANAGEVMTIFAGVMFAGALGFTADGELFLPLLPTQLLWINLVTDGAPALALGVRPAEPGHMERPPRDPREPVINRPMWILVATVGVVIMLGTLFVLDAYLPGGIFDFMVPDGGRDDVRRYARTAAFTTLLMFEMFDVFNCLSQTRSVFRSSVHRNPWVIGAVALSIGLQAAVIYWAPLQRAFATVPLTGVDWLLATGVAVSVLVAVEILKLTPFVRRRPEGS